LASAEIALELDVPGKPPVRNDIASSAVIMLP
jgi:hypothetical protein